MTSYKRFAAEYPGGVILQPPGGKSEAASPDDAPAAIRYDVEPYESYFKTDGFGLDAHRNNESTRMWDRMDLELKAVILGVECNNEALAVPLSRSARWVVWSSRPSVTPTPA